MRVGEWGRELGGSLASFSYVGVGFLHKNGWKWNRK